MVNEIRRTVDFLKLQGIDSPEIGIVLGTGLGKLVDEMVIQKMIEYHEIPNFPVSTVESHSGKLIAGQLEGKNILAMQGRFHLYEGYSLAQVTMPVRVMKLMGVKYLLLSNAAGSMNPGFKKGSLMLLDDHINMLPGNPLIGPNHDEFGPRFPDMSEPYSAALNSLFREVAQSRDVILHEGTYVVVMGPNLETRAEYRMLRNYADAVGMSTVPEVIVANHMGLPCAAVSVLTDECDPDNLKKTTLGEIIQTAAIAEVQLIKLFKGVIAKLQT
jgi:purine-nucleoside phosphorylase